MELEHGELGLHQPGLRLHQQPPLLHLGGLRRPPQPHGGLGRGWVHVDLAALHHSAVKPVPGGGRLIHAAHGDEAEPLGALVVEDDLGVDDLAVAAEETLEVWGAESEGEVGDVEAAGELLGRLPGAELLAQMVAGGFEGGQQGGRGGGALQGDGGGGGAPEEVAPLGGGEVQAAQSGDQVLAGGGQGALLALEDGVLAHKEALLVLEEALLVSGEALLVSGEALLVRDEALGGGGAPEGEGSESDFKGHGQR